MTQKFTFHVLGLPHLPVSKEFNACAYTQKVFNFCKMMTRRGHDVTLYAPEGSNAPCTAFVQTISKAEQAAMFGVYDWQKEMFKIVWDSKLPYWSVTNLRAAAEISVRGKKGDIVCVVGGSCQKPLSDALDHDKFSVTEPFIGYAGVFSRFQVFESYTHQALVARSLTGDPNGNNYHDVVPVYFDPEDFPEGAGDGDYYLYIGRLIIRKGINVAEAVCKAMGKKLLIAGQGVKHWDAEKKILVTEENQTFQGDHLEYVGYADVVKRAALMGGAIATFAPTQYIEPGGNTSVEPQACGTPVLAANYGCFAQQVVNGVTGFRPTTLEEWIYCAKKAATLDRKKIREVAMNTYSLDAVAPLFEEYFTRVYNLNMKEGWMTLNPDRQEWRCYK